MRDIAPAPAPVLPRLESVPIASLVANPRNPQRHPRDQLDGLRASIESFGQPRPVLVRRANRMLIAGHGIWQAMRESGRGEIDAVFWDCDQATADKFMAADNRWGERSTTDADALKALLGELATSELPALGFPADFFAPDKSEPILVEELDTAPVADTFWISIRGPLQHQAEALLRLKAAMADLGDVSVEQGTVLQ